MELRPWLAAVCVGVACNAAVACGLDESGLVTDASSTDGTRGDAEIDVADVVVPTDAPIDVPQACVSLDASACVSAPPPAGWTYVAVALKDAACPSPAYTRTTYLFQPQPASGACACGTCTTTGSYSCAGQAQASGKGNSGGCGTSVVFDAGDVAQCVSPQWGDPHFSLDQIPTVSGGPSCSSSVVGSQTFTAGTATACTPDCAADYCGLSGSFQRCIVTNGPASCPAPFTQAAPRMGAAQNVSVTCQACTCRVSPSGPCTATAQAFNSDDCTGTAIGSAPADGGCANFGGGGSNQMNSFLYTPVPPAVSCALTDGGSGTASFGSSLTVCCLP